MSAPQLLFAHGHAALRRAVDVRLSAEGFQVESVGVGEQLAQAIDLNAQAGSGKEPYVALVVDAALPGGEGVDFAGPAHQAGILKVILVTAVFRRAAYRRRPARLYGADDYIELHKLSADLNHCLKRNLPPECLPQVSSRDALELSYLKQIAPTPTRLRDPVRLAELLVAEAILSCGDLLVDAEGRNDYVRVLDPVLVRARFLLQSGVGCSRAEVEKWINTAFENYLRLNDAETCE